MKINICVSGQCLTYFTSDQPIQKPAKLDLLKFNAFLKHIFEKKIKNPQKQKIEKILCEKHQLTCIFENQNEILLKINSTQRKILDKILGPQEKIEISSDRLGQFILESAKKKLSTYYLYSSGGGGHKAAKDALVSKHLLELREEIKNAHFIPDLMTSDLNLNTVDWIETDPRLENPKKFINWCKKNGLIKENDVLTDYLGHIGQWMASIWNHAQQSGDIHKQKSLASKEWLANLIFGPIIFIQTLKYLIRFQPKEVISTQAIGIYAILLAIKVYNKYFASKKIKLHLYITDMPTKLASNFFDPLKSLPQWLKKNFILYSPPPSNEVDWQELCKLSPKQVYELNVKELPVHPEFLNALENFIPSQEKVPIKLNVSSHQELELLQKVLSHQAKTPIILKNKNASPSLGKQKIHYEIDPKDENVFIMLGSQPTQSAIYRYIKNYYQLAKKHPHQNYQIFIYTGLFEEEKNCFFKKLSNAILEKKTWPENLRVIPLTFQTPKQKVTLDLMCHTINRSSGVTCMELRILNELKNKYPDYDKKRYIHAELSPDGKKLDPNPWEEGNRQWLKDTVGAKVISKAPDLQK